MKIEFSIGPDTEHAYNEVMYLLNDADCVIRGISFKGDHYSEIHCYGDYNSLHDYLKQIKNISIEHWD
jgi:hypothetical protein